MKIRSLFAGISSIFFISCNIDDKVNKDNSKKSMPMKRNDTYSLFEGKVKLESRKGWFLDSSQAYYSFYPEKKLIQILKRM